MDLNVRFFLSFESPQLERLLMDLDTLKAQIADLDAKVTDLSAQVEEANGKTDELIVVANTTKDALVALQNAGGATPAQLQEIADSLGTVVAKVQAATDSLNAQDLETDAAKTAVAP